GYKPPHSAICHPLGRRPSSWPRPALPTHTCSARAPRCVIHPSPPHLHRLSDILHRLLTQVFIMQDELVLDLIVHNPRDTDASCLCQCLQPRCDVDSIPVDLFPIDHYIAEIDTNAELHPALGRKSSIFFFQ